MDFDHVHFYVEDAAQLSRWFSQRFGYSASAPDGSTGSYWVDSGAVRLAISAPPQPGVRDYLRQHPAGVVDIALRVADLDAVLTRAIAAGARLLQPPHIRLHQGEIERWAQIAGQGDLTHTLIERSARAAPVTRPPLALEQIDHVVINVPVGQLQPTVDWYQRVLGFQPEQAFQIQTPHSGLSSQVLRHPAGTAQIPINEPTSARSQIQEFLDLNRGIGVQHVALQTRHLVPTVAHLRQQGIRFLPVPPTYYDHLPERLGFGQQRIDWAAIAQQQILVDWATATPTVPLLQIFTEPILAKPTFFLEFIQRRSVQLDHSVAQALGFGAGNFRALFEAIEREQWQRTPPALTTSQERTRGNG